MLRTERILGGLWGAVIGDALGVPVEFTDRKEREKDPVTDMRGYGTWNQRPGTWSDDSSLLLCTAESLVNGFDTNDMGSRFVKFWKEGYWTPYGKVFDIGGTTRKAIARIAAGVEPEMAGVNSEDSNGNGSLMRILPVGLRYADRPSPELLECVHRVSCLTHRHPRSQMACGIYCLMAASLTSGQEPEEAYNRMIDEAKKVYTTPLFSAELPHFERILSSRLKTLPVDQISSDGYVVHTLEASIWCVLTSTSFREAVLNAVNLGGDTDTTGCVTGGLAGIYYGIRDIPTDWIDKLARMTEIRELFERFTGTNKLLSGQVAFLPSTND
jgi:ADP-ribosyl-[dinitrogen reductase] hydrolase